MALTLNPSLSPYLPAELAYASGEHTSQSGTTRLRRSHGSSSDESSVPTADGLVEEDLRAGGPHLCQPPCRTQRPIPKTHSLHNWLEGSEGYITLTQLGDICRNANFRTREMYFCGRESVLHPGPEPITTLLVVADRASLLERGWVTIARRLRNHLRGKNLGGVSVEIIDPRFVRGPNIYPCFTRDPVYPVWKRLVDEITSKVDITGVLTIGCFRIGTENSRERCPPTILVGVNHQIQKDWTVVREQILRILDSRGMKTLEVRIREDTKVPRVGDREHKYAEAEECRPDPNLGNSISPRLMKYSRGTLGGWVEIRRPSTGNWVPFALTCAHCCLPSEKVVPAKGLEALTRWEKQGVRPGDKDSSELLRVDSPSRRDIVDGIEALTSEITASRNKPTYIKVEEAKAKRDFVIPHMEASWKQVSNSIRINETKRERMKEFLRGDQHLLGYVFACSGFRNVKSTTNPKELSIRDWALVNVNQRRSAGTNAVQVRGKPGCTKLTAFSDTIPKPEDIVYKRGLVSEDTVGMYSGLQTCEIATTMVNGKEVIMKTWEHTVTKLQTTDVPFIKNGDSGSLAFEEDGLVLGIFFGGSFEGNVGYFTSTRDLIEDIRAFTGVGSEDIRIKQDGGLV